MLIRLGVWKNNKTGDNYLVTGSSLDCTNEKVAKTPNSRNMVHYQRSANQCYSRDYLEFVQNFTAVNCV